MRRHPLRLLNYTIQLPWKNSSKFLLGFVIAFIIVSNIPISKMPKELETKSQFRVYFNFPGKTKLETDLSIFTQCACTFIRWGLNASISIFLPTKPLNGLKRSFYFIDLRKRHILTESETMRSAKITNISPRPSASYKGQKFAHKAESQWTLEFFPGTRFKLQFLKSMLEKPFSSLQNRTALLSSGRNHLSLSRENTEMVNRTWRFFSWMRLITTR